MHRSNQSVLEWAGLRVRLILLPRARSRRYAFVILRRFGSVPLYWQGPDVWDGRKWGPKKTAYRVGTRRAALAACRGFALGGEAVTVGVRLRK
jgi:hypothetical protein